jgi:hypothetical protein
MSVTIVPASDPGNTPGDRFDISTGVVVTSNTPVFSGSDVRDMLGGAFSTEKPPAGRFDTRFADRGAGQVDTVFFSTPSPVTVAGYHLWLLASNEDIGVNNRDVTSFQLLVNGTAVSTVSIIPLGGSFLAAYGSEFIEVSDTFPTPITASSFEAIFTANNGQFPGPRVVELDGFGTLPDIAPTSPTWNTAQGGVDFGYRVSGSALTQDTTAALYWARGTTFADVLGGPVYSTPIEHPTGDYGPFYVPNAVLGTPPAGATHLLLVTDPNNLVAESDESNNVQPLAIPDIAILPQSAHLQTSTTVQFTYQTTGDPGPFTVGVYRSTDGAFDASDVLVASTVIPTPAPNGTTATITLSAEMPIDPARQHVLVVADPPSPGHPNGMIAETDETNNVSSFRKLALVAFTHGYEPNGRVPSWFVPMATALQQAHYAAVLPFNWAVRSALPIPNQTIIAGANLAALIRSEAARLADQPNDVVDIQLIGHSRGSVVISEALQALDNDPGSDALRLGYAKMTMLDPHPARNRGTLAQGLIELFNGSGVSRVGGFSFNPLNPVARRLAIATLVFQFLANDPEVIIPRNVDGAEIFHQQTPWFQSSLTDVLLGFNLWGLPPLNPFGRPVLWTLDLTPFHVGHTGVPQWYIDNVLVSGGGGP